MNHRYLVPVVILLGSAAGAVIWSAGHYHSLYRQEQARADTAELNLKSANATITDMQVRQRDVAALDTKYTQELTDAKNTIDQLQRDVVDGRKRLRVNASCPTVRNPTSAASVDDAGTARLTDSAQRDYFTLRERIETRDKMIRGLQEYVKVQCLK